MASKILLTLLVLVLLQGTVFLVMLLGGNIKEEIKNAAFETFDDNITTRQRALEEVLTANVYKNNVYDEILNECQLLRSSVNNVDELKVNNNIADSLKRLLHNTSSSGAFIIFESTQSQHHGLGIRDIEPSNVSINDGDLLALFGPSELIKEHGLTLDYHWQTNLSLDDSFDFYYKPVEAAKNNPNLNYLDLAYWSKPYQLSQDDDSTISFSFPLLDDQHNVYGVLGIQFTLDYLKSILPYEELSDGNGAYVLSHQDDVNQAYSPLLISGPLYHDVHDPFTLEATQSEDNIYNLIHPEKEDTDVIVRELNMYNSNSPFIDETWSLVGMVPDRILLSAMYVILRSLSIAIIAALLIGIIATFMITLYFSKPFVKLLRNLKHADPNKPLSLPKVHINELDQFSSIVENMSHHIFESSSRLSKIIRLMDLPIGAIEIDKITNKVFYTEKIGKLLNFSDEVLTKEYIMFDVYEKEIERFNKQIIAVDTIEKSEDETSKVYLIETLNEQEKQLWIRFSVLNHEDSTLVTVTDVTKETLEKQKLEYERDYDILTNLLNRRAFKEAFDETVHEKDLQYSALLLFDLDNLKFINDTYGHDFGDLYIKEASNIFLTLDINHSITSRMAGDEFLVFLYNMESKEKLTALAKDIHRAMTKQELLLTGQDKIRIRASAGIAWYPEDGKNYDELLKHADFAMYSAKHSLKGSMQMFNYDEFKTDYLMFETLEDFNKIIDEHLYQFAFQPIVDASTGEIFGYEALIRPQGKAIRTPLDLIRIARSQSKLQIIERITFKGALKEYQAQREAFGETHVFINSIPKITWSEPFINEIEEKYKTDLHRLVIEIIESDHLTSDNLRLKKDTIGRWNAAIALDDFGSGYNNDTAILTIHPHYLKIDQELIHSIAYDERRQMIVRNLIEYSKAQNIKTIGEGVETPAELKFLIEAGIDYLQGYYLAKPDFEVRDIHSDIKHEIRAIAKNRK